MCRRGGRLIVKNPGRAADASQNRWESETNQKGKPSGLKTGILWCKIKEGG